MKSLSENLSRSPEEIRAGPWTTTIWDEVQAKHPSTSTHTLTHVLQASLSLNVKLRLAIPEGWQACARFGCDGPEWLGLAKDSLISSLHPHCAITCPQTRFSSFYIGSLIVCCYCNRPVPSLSPESQCPHNHFSRTAFIFSLFSKFITYFNPPSQFQ